MLSAIAELLVVYSLQLALIVGIGLFAPVALRLRHPHWLLRYHHGVLGAALLLPWVALLGSVTAGDSNRAATAGLLAMEPLRIVVTASSGLLTMGKVLALVWLLGALARAGMLLRSLLALRRCHRGATPVADSTLEVAELGLRSRSALRVFLSERTDVPVTYGWLRPKILLPPSIVALDPGAQRAVLCHELLHIERRDWLMVLAEESVRCLLWFHPLIWLLLARLALLREQVVDREVVERTGDRRRYLDALLAVASTASHAKQVLAPRFLGARHLEQRVRELLKETPMTTLRTYVTLVPTALCVLLACGIAVVFLPLNGSPAQAAQVRGAETGTEPIHVTDEMVRPERISGENPQYTDEARKVRIQGVVIVKAVIDEQGDVGSIEILKPLPRGLSEAAAEAVGTWKFKPARLDGEPVAVYFNITVKFRLE